MNLLQSFIRSRPTQRSSLFPMEYLNFNGNTYPLQMPQQTLGFTQEDVPTTYAGLAQGAFSSNGVVFACMEARRRLFAQARFQWRQVRGGTPGRLFGNEALALLEKPWPNATTGDMLSRALQMADLSGNAFIVRYGPTLKLLRPDWVTIVAASDKEPDQGMAAIDAEIIGYIYWPGGKSQGQEPEVLMPEQVAHFAPTPDPMANFRGMSWLTPIIREVMADAAATMHKLQFFQQGATPNMVVSLDPSITVDKFNAWIEKFDQLHDGVKNAYKTMYLGGGADVEVVGKDLRQIDFKVTQGAGETRIAAAAGVPPILVGLSEGLQAATYSNYGQARRAFSDGTMWDLWRNISGSLESIVPPPAGAQLWVDSSNIPFLQEDEKDRAEIQQMDAAAINQLVTAGYDPSSVVDAITAGDLNRLVHSGLYSVQLQPAGAEAPLTEQQQEPMQTGRALVEQAEQRLLEQGTRPTVAAIAEMLDVSDRTVQRWRNGK